MTWREMARTRGCSLSPATIPPALPPSLSKPSTALPPASKPSIALIPQTSRVHRSLRRLFVHLPPAPSTYQPGCSTPVQRHDPTAAPGRSCNPSRMMRKSTRSDNIIPQRARPDFRSPIRCLFLPYGILLSGRSTRCVHESCRACVCAPILPLILAVRRVAAARVT